MKNKIKNESFAPKPVSLNSIGNALTTAYTTASVLFWSVFGPTDRYSFEMGFYITYGFIYTET